MLERFKCILCYPRFIGKFFKDKISTILLMILLFLGVYVAVDSVRIYSKNYFDDSASSIVVSSIIQGDKSNISFDTNTNILSGTEATFSGEGFSVKFFPVEVEESRVDLYSSNISIVFEAEYGYIDLGGITISQFKYEDINVDSFNLTNVQNNNPNDIYCLKVLIRAALLSCDVVFNTFELMAEVISNIFLYFVFVLISYFFSKSVNPHIEGKIRTKLCFYDNLIFFIVCIVSCLLDAEWIGYLGLILPLSYTFVTFRHIVRVGVKKD